MDKNPKTLKTTSLIWNIKTSTHEDDPMNLEQKSSSLKKHGNSEKPKNMISIPEPPENKGW